MKRIVYLLHRMSNTDFNVICVNYMAHILTHKASPCAQEQGIDIAGYEITAPGNKLQCGALYRLS